jgi:hypothetical protein
MLNNLTIYVACIILKAIILYYWHTFLIRRHIFLIDISILIMNNYFILLSKLSLL